MIRPNILFLMSDEHRADVAGFEGNPVVCTPVLDELARTGVVFRNAYTPSPICVPGRQCMMAGQLPKTCGCEGWIDLAPGTLTFSRHFSRYAYATVACGKLHHQGTDMMQGWTHRIGSEMQMSAPHIAERQEEEFQRYTRPFADYKWSDAKEIKRAGVGRGPCINHDAYTLQGALDFIDGFFNNPYYDREQSQTPLMLKVSLLQPHYPYLTDEAKFGYYLNRVQPFLEGETSDHPFLKTRQVRPGTDALEREIRRATAAYYGMVETVDEHFGRVIDALRFVGQDPDEWVILYTTDHGEMLGEHGVWEKQKFCRRPPQRVFLVPARSVTKHCAAPFRASGPTPCLPLGGTNRHWNLRTCMHSCMHPAGPTPPRRTGTARELPASLATRGLRYRVSRQAFPHRSIRPVCAG